MAGEGEIGAWGWNWFANFKISERTNTYKDIKENCYHTFSGVSTSMTHTSVVALLTRQNKCFFFVIVNQVILAASNIKLTSAIKPADGIPYSMSTNNWEELPVQCSIIIKYKKSYWRCNTVHKALTFDFRFINKRTILSKLHLLRQEELSMICYNNLPKLMQIFPLTPLDRAWGLSEALYDASAPTVRPHSQYSPWFGKMTAQSERNNSMPFFFLNCSRHA